MNSGGVEDRPPHGGIDSRSRRPGRASTRFARRTRAKTEERRALQTRVFADATEQSPLRFAFLLALSVAIAVMGLTAGSTAVVIGAMLIAPLMTPVMSFAGALVLGWTSRLVRSAAIVAVGSIGAVALAWLVARLLPAHELTSEVLSRTTPDIRDLAVALLAGAAGAYAISRQDLSAALPGVAVAVALVPPLATIGVVLEAGRSDYAEGAALLYCANLAAIVLAGAAIFLANGLVPPGRLRQVTRRVVGGFLLVALVTVGIGIPLAARSISVANQLEDVAAVDAQVRRWLPTDTQLRVEKVTVDGHAVTVDLDGPDVPPLTGTLTAAVSSALNRAVAVNVRWQQRSDLRASTDKLRATEEQALDIARAWLVDASDGTVTDEITSIHISGGDITVDLVGPQTPPPANSLAKALKQQFGTEPSVSIRWTQQVIEKSGTTGSRRDVETGARAASEAWARQRSDISVLEVQYESGTITVDLAGPEVPSKIPKLVKSIKVSTQQAVTVKVRFFQRTNLN